MSQSKLDLYLQQLHLPSPDSHKGQNGKVMVIGGSELFHAASRWSLDVVSKCVDMVFYASVPSNNELMREAKGAFWNGIVIERAEIENYIEEADCILIGPGMVRSQETAELSDALLKKFPTKKWVVDAGALQMINPERLTANCIVTPHLGEFKRLLGVSELDETEIESRAREFSLQHDNVCLVIKGPTDWVIQGEQALEVSGGNGGMTKGGTGDVLAGLIAGLFATNEILTAAVVGSLINKRAGDRLFEKVGPFFNSSDLVQEIPPTLWQAVTSATAEL